MDAFFASTGAILLAEIGDKTQILAIFLTARYRAPLLVLGAIVVATLLNHGAAVVAGSAIAGWIDPGYLPWLVAACLLGVAVWLLFPDDAEANILPRCAKGGPFAVSTISFFLLEIGDKTQVATVVLAARYEQTVAVLAGSTLGMVLANLPAVLFAGICAKLLRQAPVRYAGALLYAGLAIATVAN